MMATSRVVLIFNPCATPLTVLFHDPILHDINHIFLAHLSKYIHVPVTG
jgi:hypothetical protein